MTLFQINRLKIFELLMYIRFIRNKLDLLNEFSSLNFNVYFNKTAKSLCNMKKLLIEKLLKQNNFKSLFDLILLQLLGLCISFPLFNFSTPNKLKRNNFNLQLKVFPQS